MSLFKAAAWDSDVTGDDLCKDLNKDSKKHNKKKQKSNKFSGNKIEKVNKKRKKQLEKRLINRKDDKIISKVNLLPKQNYEDNKDNKKHKRKLQKLSQTTNAKPNLEPNEQVVTKNKASIKTENGTLIKLRDSNCQRIKEKKRKKLKAVKNKSDAIVTQNNIDEENINKMKKKQKKKRNKQKLETSSTIIETEELPATKVKNLNKKNNVSLILDQNKTTENKHKYGEDKINVLTNSLKKKQKMLNKLQNVLAQNDINKKKKPVLTLRQKMMEKLKAARFRFLNEQIYTSNSKEAEKIFKTDPDAFKAYHNGYKQQVQRWPVNPLDIIIKSIKKMPKNYVIADFGCGEARLAESVAQTVHSFDLVAVNDTVIACDMAHVPLKEKSVDVAVFCLSLMGINLNDYVLEANRVLKVGGIFKIAEVESRFEDVESFIKGVHHFGFKKTWKDLSHNLFYFIDFKKENDIKNKKNMPSLSLSPCLYKKR